MQTKVQKLPGSKPQKIAASLLVAAFCLGLTGYMVADDGHAAASPSIPGETSVSIQAEAATKAKNAAQQAKAAAAATAAAQAAAEKAKAAANTKPAPSSSLTASTPATTSPTASQLGKLYVDPYTAAAAQLAAWAGSRPADAALMRKLAETPQAIWLTGNSADADIVSRALNEAAATGSRPVFVTYAIPHRDGGQYSAGGFASGAAYLSWIDSLTARIGSRPAIVIVEPDAVPMGAGTATAERNVLLTEAVKRLGALPDTKVYLDAGNSGWLAAGDVAARLSAAGVAYADGFSLNISNFMTTDSQIAYGRAVSAAIGGKPFVIDTSRNGNGPLASATGEDAWCNPAGRAVGQRPTLSTGVAGVDAYLWIKRPGESDGACRGAAAAGQWLPEYALELVRGAKW